MRDEDDSEWKQELFFRPDELIFIFCHTRNSRCGGYSFYTPVVPQLVLWNPPHIMALFLESRKAFFDYTHLSTD